MAGLEPFRKEINEIDVEVMALLGRRLNVCRRAARFKKAEGIPMMQHDRVEEVKDRAEALARDNDLDPEFIRALYTMIIDDSCRVEDEIIEGEG